MTGSLVLLPKPNGVSSFAALSPVKRALGHQKIGHTGTLDPFAEGLLVVLCGYATRLAPFFSDLDKRYIAEIRFGASTDTLDPEGVTDGTSRVPRRDEVESAILSQCGEIDQIPPRFSAIKIGGLRAYREARKGKTIEIPPRTVTIHSVDLLEYSPPSATISVHCSKGAYIRSLARDIAKACGSVAYVRRLNRSRVGPFLLDEIAHDEPWRYIEPFEALKRLDSVRVVRADPQTTRCILYGKQITASDLTPQPVTDGVYAVGSLSDALLAVMVMRNDELNYKMVVPRSAQQFSM